jgi:methylated-DNA-[protein]-cysteine S-methyltransferase
MNGPVAFRMLDVEHVPSPLGPIVVYSTAAGICALDFADRDPDVVRLLERRYGPFATTTVRGSVAARRLDAYFGGDLGALDGLTVDPGGTPFQRAVWQALRGLPPGVSSTYADLARGLGRPGAARAVGGASARNPIALVIPCHRVVGANGALVGYAGGLERKRWLLRHEARARTGTISREEQACLW